MAEKDQAGGGGGPLDPFFFFLSFFLHFSVQCSFSAAAGKPEIKPA